MRIHLLLRLSTLVVLVSSAQNREHPETSVKSSSKESETQTPVPILRQINEILEDGSYRFGYEGGDGSFRIETRQPDGTVQGKYGFRDADGQIRVVDYSATNETGFDAQGEHIPKGPPPARGKPNDFDEIDYDELTTTRTPRPTRPTRPPTQRPRTTTPRPRPRPKPVPLPQVQDAFEEESDFDDPAVSFQEIQQRPQQLLRQQPHRQPEVRPRPAPTRRPTSRPRPVVQEGLFEEPVRESPFRSPTPVRQSSTGRIVAKPTAATQEVTTVPRTVRPQSVAIQEFQRPQQGFLEEFPPSPTGAAAIISRPQSHRGSILDDFQSRPSGAFLKPQRQHVTQFQTLPPPKRRPQEVEVEPFVEFQQPRQKPHRRPQVIKEFEDDEFETQRAPTITKQRKVPQQVIHVSNIDEFEVNPTPTTQILRRPTQPSLPKPIPQRRPDEEFEIRPQPMTFPRPTPQSVRQPEGEFEIHPRPSQRRPPGSGRRPIQSIDFHGRPRPQESMQEFRPQQRPQLREQPRRPQSGSVIDDFLAASPQTLRSRPRQHQRQHQRQPVRQPIRQPVFDEDEFEIVPPDSRQRRPQQRLTTQELRGVMGHTHGFILQQSPSTSRFRNANGQLVERTQLTQTVPGAKNPFTQTLL